MQRYLLTPAQTQEMQDHVQTKRSPFVVAMWETYLDNVQKYGFGSEDVEDMKKLFGMNGAIAFDPTTFHRLHTSMNAWLKSEPDTPEAAPPPLDFIARAWKALLLLVATFVGVCVGTYKRLPPVRVMLGQLVHYMVRLIGFVGLVWIGWILLCCIWAIDIVWIVSQGHAFVGWVVASCAYADATFWSCMTLPRWNVTLPRWNLALSRRASGSSWRRPLDIDTRLGALNTRVDLLERFTGSETSELLQQLSSNVTIQSEIMVLGSKLQVYNQTNADLKDEIQSLAGQLQVYERKNLDLAGQLQSHQRKSLGLNESLQILLDRLSGVEAQLARVEATGVAALMVAGATALVGATTTVMTGGFLALGKLALGYVVAALCEYGALHVLVD